MPEFKLKFVREKETKRTVRFQEQPQGGKPPVVGLLYMQRWAAGQANEVDVILITEGAESPGAKSKK